MDDSEKRKDSDSKDEMAALQEAKRRPAQHLRDDDVSVSIWARDHLVDGGVRTFYACTFERCYKDLDGTWNYTGAFDLRSLEKVVKLARQAAGWIGVAVNREGSK